MLLAKKKNFLNAQLKIMHIPSQTLVTFSIPNPNIGYLVTFIWTTHFFWRSSIFRF